MVQVFYLKTFIRQSWKALDSQNTFISKYSFPFPSMIPRIWCASRSTPLVRGWDRDFFFLFSLPIMYQCINVVVFCMDFVHNLKSLVQQNFGAEFSHFLTLVFFFLDFGKPKRSKRQTFSISLPLSLLHVCTPFTDPPPIPPGTIWWNIRLFDFQQYL